MKLQKHNTKKRCTGFLLLMLPLLANATTYFVKPGGTGDCLGWATACGTLATAKTKVTKNTDEIWVQAGLYKIAAEVVPGTYALKIYGGFNGSETSRDSRDPVKNVVVFSADSAGDDTSLTVDKITPSYTNIAGTNAGRIFNFSSTGVVDTSPINILDGVTLTGMNITGAVEGGVFINNAKVVMDNVRFIGNKGHMPGIYIKGAFSTADLTNMEFTNNYAVDDAAGSGSEIADGGAIYMDTANTFVTCEFCKFTGNKANVFGGAVSIKAGARIDIKNAAFENNTAVSNGGAVSLSGVGASAVITGALFNNNTATTHGGGLYMENTAVATVNSSTFFDNKGGQLGGAIGNYNSNLTLQYSTIFNNKTTSSPNPGNGLGAGIAAWPSSSSANDLKSNIIMGNYNTVTNATQNIWRLKQTAGTNPVFTDSGFNIIGYGSTGTGAGAGLWEGINIAGYDPQLPTSITFATLFPTANTTKTVNPVAITTANKIIETTLDVNGGIAKSLKLAEPSIARNSIPNDLVASGIGTTPTDPFTSIAQARGAMASYDSYKAGKYFFYIGGIAFATYVDKAGYVLVASADTSVTTAAPYTEVSTLLQRSDSILNSNIMAKFTTAEIDEVRISSYSGGARGTFDGFSNDPDVINSLALFKVLPNSFNGGSWIVKGSSIAKDYFSGATAAPVNGGAPSALSLSYSIFNANGNTNSMAWIPNTAKEALIDSVSVKDELDLWVRSSKGNCNGTINTDQRNLPRADYVNPNDPNQYGDIHDCDIGGFEWNDGYQQDCYTEDGDRPAPLFTPTESEVQVCLQGNVTPKAVLDSLGSFNYQSLILLLLLHLYRSRKIRAQIQLT